MSKMDRYFVKYASDCFTAIRPVAYDPKTSRKSPEKFEFSPDQEAAFKGIRGWMRSKPSQILTLGGVAGSGKSTLISALAGELYNEPVAFCALTGKAANVLRTKMAAAGVDSPHHSVSTIHSLLYQCFSQEPDPSCKHELEDGACKNCKWSGKIFWQRKNRESFGDYKTIVVDEGSMLGDGVIGDLLSYGLPLLIVGDHAQLPPIGSAANLMERPALRLEQIHRQARGNPILELSAWIREHGDLPKTLPGSGDHRLRLLRRHEFADVMREAYDQNPLSDVGVLCWMNATRNRMNQTLRQILYRSSEVAETPREGDQILCLKNAFGAAFNGMRGVLGEISEAKKSAHFYEGVALFADENVQFRGSINRHGFGHPAGVSTLLDFQSKGFQPRSWQEMGFLADFGYCLTVHKAQGSQFRSAVVVRERPSSASADVARRWLYTAVTRASDQLAIML